MKIQTKRSNELDIPKINPISHQIKVTEVCEVNLFRYKFKGIFLSEKSIEVIGYSEVVDKIPSANLVKDQQITIDSTPILDKLEIGKEYTVTCLFSLYCNNPEKGVVLTVTKIL